MDADALRQAVTQAGPAAAGIGFLAGLVFSVNPVALAAIPVSLAYVTKARERPQAIQFGAMFILGMLVTHAILGFAAGLGGHWVESLLGRAWRLLLGPLLILLGVVAGLGSPWFGVVLLLAFALGRAVPLALGAASIGWLENLRRLAGYRRIFEIAGGLTMVASGLYLLNAYYAWIPELAV